MATKYVVKAGDTLTGIAAAHGITVDQLVAWNSMITVGQVLKLSDGVTPPTPTTPNIGGIVKLYEATSNPASAKIIQTALNYEFGGVTIDGDFGPQSQAAYTKWQESLGEAAQPWDGLPGKVSLPPLGKKYGFTVDIVSQPPAGVEPAQNYSRTTFSGRTVNQRTKDMLNTAQAIYGKSISLSQGSYNAGGVSASAGTHDGGGVVDIPDTSTALLIALKKAGFAAWIRTPNEGFAYHIHACAIGDREMASSAKNQITSFFNGRNALVSNARDSHPDRYYPAWTKKYGAPI